LLFSGLAGGSDVTRARSRGVAAAAVFVLGAIALQSCSEVLQYDRQQVLSGEIWRIWTAHIVHTNVLHLLLNTASALLIYFGFFRQIALRELLVSAVLFSALISAGLFFFLPGLDWYNGLSGLLHGLVAYFSIRLAVGGARVYWLWLGAVWLKVLIEWSGVNPGYGNLIGDMNVITDAHLAGALIGTVSGLVVCFFRHRKPNEFKGSGPLL
tara:strand:+ start:312 stop:944 length:633 start_codon:yes stop_codon:yes gene_type:complete